MERRLGCRGALLLFLSWGFFGLMLGAGLIHALSEAWKNVAYGDPNDVPPGIMLVGIFGTLIAILSCGVCGVAVGSYRTRKWGIVPARRAGIAGPVLGSLSGLVAIWLFGPMGFFIGALIGLSIGIHLGQQWGTRKLKGGRPTDAGP